MKQPKIKEERKLPFYKNTKKLVTIGIAVFFIFIMATSVIELYFSNRQKEDVYEYNSIKFVNTGNGWLAYLKDGRPLFIVSNPKDLENTTITPLNIASLNYAEKIYLSYNPKERNRIALSEFLREIKFTPRIVYACPEDNELCFKLPLKTCNDATSTAPIILMKEANETSVTFINSCLTIQGKDLTKIVDKLILVTQT